MKIYRYGHSIEKLGQRYRLEGSLGHGGMADICLAWDERDQREVAIKVITSNGIDPDTLNRFVREGSLTRGWQHPHIMQIYDDVRIELLDTTTGSSIPYLVMEYVTGGTLQDRLKINHPYPFPRTITVFGQLCAAIQYAHEHDVIHRDLKPSNILFKSAHDEKDFIVLSDFGMAVSTTATHHTFPKGGTPFYMAPEQFLGQTVRTSDIFALGIILYRLCTGQMPFQPEQLHQTPLLMPTLPSSLNTALPKALDQVILTALHEDPHQRYASPNLFWQQIQAAIRPPKAKTQSPTAIQPAVSSQSIPEPPAKREIPPDAAQESEHAPAAPKSPQSELDPHKVANTTAQLAQEQQSQPEPAPAVGAIGGSAAGFALADLTNNPLRSQPPQNIPDQSAAVAIDPATGAAAGPYIIDLSQRKGPRTTAQLPPLQLKPADQQTTPPRTPRRSSAIAAGALAGAALGAAALAGSAQPTSAPPITRTPPASPPPPRAVPNRQVSYPKRPRRSPMPLSLLLWLLTVLLVSGSMAYLDHPMLSSVLGSSVKLPGVADLVTVTIMPASQVVSNSYVITGTSGTPDPKQQTIKARSLTGTAQSQTLTAKASGHNQAGGTAATGILTFFNLNSTAVTIRAHTVFTASNGVQVWNNTSVTIPPGNPPATLGSTDVSATVLSVGVNGNIGPGSINQSCCTGGVAVKNNGTFSGGIDPANDPANYNFVTQDDVNAVATQAVQNQLAQQANNQLKSKLASGEQLAESPQCQTSVSSDSPIGDHHQNVQSANITVSAICNSVAYDDQGMRTLVTQLLTQKAQISPGAGYLLQNNRIIIDSKVQSVDPVSLNVTAKGQWVYQFGDQQKNDLFALAKGKSLSAATMALLSAKGVSNATIQFSGTTLPTDISQYNFVFENPHPLPI